MSKTHKKPWWSPIAHFGAHGFVGTIIFLIIMVPAVLLNHLVQYLAKFGISDFTLLILGLLEHAIVLVGVVCGRGRNPTLRLWPTIFSGKIDVFRGDRRSRLISSMTSVAPA